MATTLAPPALTFDSSAEDWNSDDWTWPVKAPLRRSTSVNSTYGYGVTVIGGWQQEEKEESPARTPLQKEAVPAPGTAARPPEPLAAPAPDRPQPRRQSPKPSPTTFAPTPIVPRRNLGMISPPIQPRPVVSPIFSPNWTMEPSSTSPLSRPHSPLSGSPVTRTPYTRSPNISRPGTPSRPRRRSSQQRVSLIAGRLALLPLDQPAHPEAPQRLVRSGSTRSFLSVAASVGPPAPGSEDLLNERSICEFVVEKEIGRGAYGLVKRAREMDENGRMGPPLIIKQIIKSRILADCWKRHPKHGTIPIEIYVLNSISSTSYTLPPRRPWDPQRMLPSNVPRDDDWVEGKVVKGHPNICPMLDFFEDDQYYYMVMPSTTIEPTPEEPSPPSDLFDLVESHPNGLPPDMIRSYLGQIADAMAFLHSKGIVHRDIKDENVVLGPKGKAVLIDFGSSGLVKKTGWDTFSGTLDYAGPEILRGERYYGKEQDVWAFGVVAFVLLVGECPFTTAAEAQDGLDSPFCSARIALDERCASAEAREGEEADGGGALEDAAALVCACLQVDLTKRPTFDSILQSRFLMGRGGWAELEEA